MSKGQWDTFSLVNWGRRLRKTFYIYIFYHLVITLPKVRGFYQSDDDNPRKKLVSPSISIFKTFHVYFLFSKVFSFISSFLTLYFSILLNRPLIAEIINQLKNSFFYERPQKTLLAKFYPEDWHNYTIIIIVHIPVCAKL